MSRFHLCVVCAALTALCALIVLLGPSPGLAQESVARYEKSELLEKMEYFDRKNTQPKLYEEYYEIKSYDKNDVVLATEKMFHGYRIEWNKTGLEKRTLRSKQDMVAGYLKLVEQYEDGLLTMRIDFHDSGKESIKCEYSAGVLTKRVEKYDTKEAGDGPEKLSEKYDAGRLVFRQTWNPEGKLTLSEEYQADSEKLTTRDVLDYHKNGRLKSSKSEKFKYGGDGALVKTDTVEVTQSEKGVYVKTIDGIKREEGTLKLIDNKEVKDGEWNYWDATAKLIRLEKYKKGVLEETQEFK